MIEDMDQAVGRFRRYAARFGVPDWREEQEPDLRLVLALLLEPYEALLDQMEDEVLRLKAELARPREERDAQDS